MKELLKTRSQPVINQDYLEALFQEYFSDVDPKDENAIKMCYADFVDEAGSKAIREALEYLADKKTSCDDDMSFDAPEK